MRYFSGENGRIAMQTLREEIIFRLQFAFRLAATVGLTTGLLVGIWDSIMVLVRHAPYPFVLDEALSFTLYSMALYGTAGFLATFAIGVIATAAITTARYYPTKSRLSGIILGISASFAIYVLLRIEVDALDFIERLAIAALAGLGVGTISAYIAGAKLPRLELAPLCLSLVVWMSSWIFIGLWVHDVRLPEGVRSGSGILIYGALLVFSGLAAVGVYRLTIFFMQRLKPRTTVWSSSLLAGIVVIACITLSSLGPFDFSASPQANKPAYIPEVTESLPQQSPSQDRPNIIWIVMDTVRADHLSCYGYDHTTTPNIDNIASEGVLFENAFSVAPWTLPSHASMFTGLLTCEHDTHGSLTWLSDRFATIAEVLAARGYQTLGYTNNPTIIHETNLTQGFQTWVRAYIGGKEIERDIYGYLRGRWFIRSLFGQKVRIVDDIKYEVIEDDGAQSTNETVKGWISTASRQDNPFFIFINYMEAHKPLHPPESYARPFLPDGISWIETLHVRHDTYKHISGVDQHDDKELKILRALYDGSIYYLDSRMGELFEHLRQLDLMDETMIIITSDHGENFGEHGLMGHMLCVYDTLLHVPLIIRYPSVFEPGLRVEEMVQLIDIFPTIIDILDIDSEELDSMRGKSRAMEGEEAEENFIIAQDRIWPKALKNLLLANPYFDISVYQRELESIRTEDFKYIWGTDGKEELYDISIDQHELNNIIDEDPETAKNLRELLEASVSSCHTMLHSPILNDGQPERLEAEGQ
jgi:arylsulfatase A-like enzyme